MNNILFQLKIFIRRLCYIGIFFLDTYLLQRKQKIIILCYHSVDNDTWHYGVSFSTLKKQITYLKKYYTPLTTDDLALYFLGKKKISSPSFIVTFDDGYKDILQTKEFFQKVGVIPTLFVCSDPIHINRKEVETQKPLLTNTEVLSLHKAGWIIGSHGATHADFFSLSKNDAIREIITSRTILQKNLRLPVDYVAYPKGRYTKTVLSCVKEAGYTLGFSMDDDTIAAYRSSYIIPRVGVNRTQTFIEFKGMILPTAIQMRKFIKNKIGVIL